MILLVVASGFALTLGTVVGFLAASAGLQPRSAATDGSRTQALADQMESVSAALRDLQRAVSESRVASESQPRPIAPESADGLIAAVGSLEARLHLVEDVLKDILNWTRNVQPGDLPRSFQIPTQAGRVDELASTVARDPVRAKAEHLSWTHSDVYRQYGTPDAFYENGTRWVYLHVDPTGKRRNVMFSFQAGVVTGVGFEN